MNRRRFLLASGATILGSSAGVNSHEPVVGLDFELSATPNADPANVESILIEFSQLNLIPKYIDKNLGDATVSIEVDLENREPVQKETSLSITNGEKITKSDINDVLPVVVENVGNSAAVDGTVTVNFRHPSVQDSYTQDFLISDSLVLDNLFAWWPLNENTGSVAEDITDGGNNGSVVGSTQGVYGIGGLTGYSFDRSSSDYVDTNISSVSAPFTWSVWVRPRTNGKRQTIAGNYNAGSDDIFFECRSDGKIALSLDDLGGGSDIGSYQPHEWIHLVGVVSDNGVSLYKNTDQILEPDKSSGSKQSWSSGVNLGIGNNPSNSPEDHGFDGYISDFRWYNRALSQDEIESLYKWGNKDYTNSSLHDGTDPDAVSRWRFNQPSTTAAVDSWDSNDGVIKGSNYDVNSITNSGYSLNFTNNEQDWVDLGTSNFPIDNFTISLWFNTEKWNDFEDVIQHSTSNTNQGDENRISLERANNWDGYNDAVGSRTEDGIMLLLGNNNGSNLSAVFTETEFEKNTWNHIAFGLDDNDEAVMYVNGRSENKGNVNITPDSIGTFGVGLAFEEESSRWFDGLIDDVRVYSRVLNDKEVFQLYQWGTRGQNLRDVVRDYQP